MSLLGNYCSCLRTPEQGCPCAGTPGYGDEKIPFHADTIEPTGVQREPSGDWIQVHSGGRFYPLDPRPEHIHLDDIAIALSRINRYAGHTQWAYSVAQHSVYVSAMVPPEFALCALMHDAPEAYLVDIPRPVKKALPAYYEMEDRVWRVIADKYMLPVEMPQCVKYADNAVLLAEKEQLLKPTGDKWDIPATPAPIHITRMNDDEACMFFLKRFNFLIGAR